MLATVGYGGRIPLTWVELLSNGGRLEEKPQQQGHVLLL